MIISGKHLRRKQMVIKVDKSEEFKKSGKKLISEYDAQEWLDKIEKNDERELFEMKRKKEFLDELSLIHISEPTRPY